MFRLLRTDPQADCVPLDKRTAGPLWVAVTGRIQ
jgi:hypothetical protein